MVFSISHVIQQNMLDRIIDTNFYGIIIDKSTSTSMTCHPLVFTIFIKENMFQCVFLGLLHINDNKNYSNDISNINKNYIRMELACW